MLIGAAAVHAIVHALRAGMINRAPYVQPAGVIGVLEAAAGFLLPAAIIIGVDRWPAGRRWLLGAAALFTIAGVLNLGMQAWFAWSQTQDLPMISDTVQSVMVARAFVSVSATTVGMFLVAGGLWLARPPRSVRGRRGTAAAIAIGVLGLVALGGGLALASIIRNDFRTSALYGLTALGSGGTALVAIAALRCIPRRGTLPELLVAIGAALAVVAVAWTHWLLVLQPLQDIPRELGWVIIFPVAIGVLGMLVAVVGFAFTRLFPQPEAHG